MATEPKSEMAGAKYHKGLIGHDQITLASSVELADFYVIAERENMNTDSNG